MIVRHNANSYPLTSYDIDFGYSYALHIMTRPKNDAQDHGRMAYRICKVFNDQ